MAWTSSRLGNWAWNPGWKLLNNDEVWTLYRKAFITRNVLLETHTYPSVGVKTTPDRALHWCWVPSLTQAVFKLSHSCLSPPRAMTVTVVTIRARHGVSSPKDTPYLTLGAWSDLPCPPCPWLGRAPLPYAYTLQPGCSHLRNTSTLSHGTGGEPQQHSTVKGVTLRNC